jgi:uncharacterized damage-inducible protein DinB
MNWTELLKSEIESSYAIVDRLLPLVDEKRLDWTPESGTNWMTTGQLLHHLTTACGGTVRGFVTGDWGMPEGGSAEDLPADEMLPPAESLPTATSVADARKRLAEDRLTALQLIEEAGEQRLATEDTTAPWDPTPMSLGQRLLHMIGHLSNHKAQLYYYLKLQGQPVNTMHYYGMAETTPAE